MKIFFALTCLLIGNFLATESFAQSTNITAITLDPESPLADQLVRLRIDASGCPDLPASVPITRQNQIVRAELWYSDFCEPANTVPYRYYELGNFGAGSYMVEVYICQSNPPPFPSGCDLYAERTLQVLSSEPKPLPGLSFANSIGLIALLILLSSIVLFKKAGSD